MSRVALSPQVSRLLELVSGRTGVIRSLNRVTRGVEEPSPPVLYHALLSNFDFKKGNQSERGSAGKGVTDNEAIGGAIGEAVERYCASHAMAGSVKRLAWVNAGPDAVRPTDCVLYSERQYAKAGFPYRPWKPESETAWLPMVELPEGREVLAPASLIYLNYAGEKPEDFFCPPTSNGLAAGPDLESAIRSGLCELAERDAFLMMWMNRLPVPEVDFARSGGVASSIFEHYERFGISTRVFNLTTDLPMYAMMAVSVDPTGRGPAIVVGLGCHLDPRIAVARSLFEICQVRPGEVRKFSENNPGAKLKRYEDVKTLEDHSAFFTIPERRGEFDFLLENSTLQRLEDLPNRSTGLAVKDLDTCVQGLRRAGCRPLYADLTTGDVKDFGICVVRTIATGLQPMHFGWGEERLGGNRLFELPRKLEYGETIRTEDSLNPCPHPLA